MTDWLNRCHFGDCLETLRRMPDGIVNTCVTSPPYFGLRDYGHPGQIGLEPTPDEFVAKLVDVFREVRRVLRDDGTLWLNLGDSYATGAGKAVSPGGGAQGERFLEAGPSGHRGSRGPSAKHKMPQTADAKNPNAGIPLFQPNRMPLPGLKPKDLIGIPWMVAFALRADGWWLRQDIVWHKPGPMPESTEDRCTKAHEYVFLLAKSQHYYFDFEAIKEPSTGRPAGNVNPQKGEIAYLEGDEKLRTRAGLTAFAERTRSKRDSFKREDSKRAEVIPSQSVGTHRPDRDESEYPLDERRKRSVWTVATATYDGTHFAVFPPKLIEPCVLAGAPAGGVVLDPFLGSGTTAFVAERLGRKWIGCELNEAYKPLQDERLRQPSLDLEAACP